MCGSISFELVVNDGKIYQCHCSKCRKVSGSASNSAMVIDRSRFRWIGGESDIQQFVQASGFQSWFCPTCGSPVPNLTSGDKSYWIPMGLVEGNVDARIVKHVFVESKANWEVIPDGIPKFDDNGG
ncbi:MAG: aldehyde-activating protein [Gammaproteobacteria bacterium]|nr:aldehyde-activating protein [Gammaproteobacteria bacterium]